MASTTAAEIISETEAQALTDGFHLVIDALKLNDIKQSMVSRHSNYRSWSSCAGEGMRVISFRHEQHAGNAASIAGYLTQKPGICLTVSAPGFLNGLTAWPMPQQTVFR